MKTQWFRFAGHSAVVILAAALGGCSSSTPEPTPPKIVTSDTSALSGAEALLTATLGVDEDGCVFAQTNDPQVTLIWPKGYTVQGDSAEFQVLDPDGHVIARSGDDLAITGGFADSVGDEWGEQGCANGPLWMVGNVAPA